MASDINKYPHTHSNSDAVVIDLREATKLDSLHSLHDVLEELGSLAIERITTDPAVLEDAIHLITEATRLVHTLPSDEPPENLVSAYHETTPLPQSMHLITGTPDDEATG